MNRLRPLSPGKANTSGFTIVELLIVMAIAGLIMLIVFQAIPLLERASRNNQRKQDVQTILEAVSHYELNDSGNFPADCGGANPDCTSAAGGPGAPNDYFLRFVSSDLGYYTNNQVVLQSQSAGAAVSPNPDTDHETVYVFNYQKCDANDAGATSQGAGYTDVVALYALESGKGPGISQCEQL